VTVALAESPGLRLRGVGRVVARVGLATAVTLLALEAVVRLAVPSHEWRVHDSSMDWQVDALQGWVQRPHIDVTTRSDQGSLVHFQTNGDGLRPASAQRERDGRYRVLLVGDSTVVARSVPPELTLHHQLEQRLAAVVGPVEVINAGVEGYSADQTLLQLRRLLPLYRPDLVIYGFCDNDLGPLEMTSAYGVPKPRFVLGPGGELELVTPSSSAREIPTFGASGPRKWVQRSALYRLARPRITILRARLGDWQNRNMIGMLPEIYSDPEILRTPAWELFEAIVVAMDRDAAGAGAQFAMFAHPALAEVWDPYFEAVLRESGADDATFDRRAIERALAGVTRKHAIPFCPLIDWFRARQDEGPFHLLPRDPHCNGTGYRLTSEALAICLSTVIRPRAAARAARAPSPRATAARRDGRAGSGSVPAAGRRPREDRGSSEAATWRG
jgi:hypothetical protein